MHYGRQLSRTTGYRVTFPAMMMKKSYLTTNTFNKACETNQQIIEVMKYVSDYDGSEDEEVHEKEVHCESRIIYH